MSKQRDTDEDSPQFQPGASQYRPQNVESDDEINREIASEFDDRIDPDTSDAEPRSSDDSRGYLRPNIDRSNPFDVPPPK
jgi:hypothetical protein